MGLAGPLRRRAIHRINSSRTEWVLDSGAGPGTSSRMLIENGFANVIGLDPSNILLAAAKAKLAGSFNPVLGVAENIPLRKNSVGGVITCFSLRDVRDRARCIGEFNRVLKKNGRLEIVDVGKPDPIFIRRLIGIYIALVMPILARIFIGKRDKRNPFRAIIPTFRQLSTNHHLREVIKEAFGFSTLHEFLLGGLVLVEAQKSE